MTTVQEAKELLAKAEAEEKENNLKKELKGLIKDYEGKCYSTHTFERISQATSIWATHYEKFFIKEGNIVVLERSFHVSKYNPYGKKTKYVTSFNRNMSERQLTGNNNYNASYNLYSGYSHYKHEIPLAIFEELWGKSMEITEDLIKVFKRVVPELREDLIRQGDHDYEEIIKKANKELGIEYIDINDYPKVASILEYVRLPMFDRNRFLPKVYARQIIQWHITQLDNERKDQWSSHRTNAWNTQRIDVLTDFLNQSNLP